MAMQSVLRSLLVLEAVAEHQPVRVGELTPLLGLPKSTVQRSLETLAEAGWLRQVDGDLTRWALTSRARSVVLRSGGEDDLREAALPPMQQLRDAAGETAHLFVPTGSYRGEAAPLVGAAGSLRGGGRGGGRPPPKRPHDHPAGHGLSHGGQLGGHSDARARSRRAGGGGHRRGPAGNGRADQRGPGEGPGAG